MSSKEYSEGWQAYFDGEENPYPHGAPAYFEWEAGFNAAKDA